MMIETLWQETVYAARSLTRTPGVALAAILTIAIGVGATMTIFSAVNTVLLRPLPYAEPDRIVRVWNAWDDTPRGALSPAEYFDYLARLDVFEHLGVYATDVTALTGGGEPERVRTGFLSHQVLPALGVTPQIGRSFTSDEDAPGHAVVLLSDGLWRTRFGAASDVIGRRILLDDEAHTVIGVLPAGFRLPEDFDTPEPAQLFVPLALDPQTMPGRGSHFLDAVGRLREGVTVDRAFAQIRTVAEQFPRELPTQYPAAMRFTAGVTPLHEDVVGDVRPVLLTLLAAIGFVLLIACGNITHLFLSRGERRRDEFSIRLALGATRAGLFRQTLIESVLVAAAGGLAAMVVAAFATRALVALSPPDVPRIEAVAVDGVVLAFGAAASLLVGVLVGIAPALRSVRGVDASVGSLRGVVGAAPSRQRIRSLLVASEVALAIVLTLGAGLMVKSLVNLLAVDPGYRTDGVLTASISLPAASYDTAEKTTTFFSTLLDRLRSQPGVVAAGGVTGLPLTDPRGDLNFQIEGRETAPGERSRRADWQVVTPGYFDALGMRLLQGRGIQSSDRADSPGAVVINQAMARLHWPEGDAIGARMRLGGGAGPGWVTVVGIVNDVRHATLRAEPRPEMYLAHTQFRFWGGGSEPVRALTLVARTTGSAGVLAEVFRREVAMLNSSLPLDDVRTMESVRSASMSSLRFISLLLSGFAAVALLVTSIGVFGVMTYAVAQRQREIGVRMALGAAPGAVVRLMLRQGVAPAVIGIAGGVGAGMLLTRALRTQLFEVVPHDPATAAAVCSIVGLVALLACYLPARRAARVDPVTALRAD